MPPAVRPLRNYQHVAGAARGPHRHHRFPLARRRRLPPRPGLELHPLEENQALQDAALSAHHLFVQTLSETSAYKIIKNQKASPSFRQRSRPYSPFRKRPDAPRGRPNRALRAGKYRNELFKEHTGKDLDRLWQHFARTPAR